MAKSFTTEWFSHKNKQSKYLRGNKGSMIEKKNKQKSTKQTKEFVLEDVEDLVNFTSNKVNMKGTTNLKNTKSNKPYGHN